MSAYKRAIAELKNKITAGEQTVMDELARIDVCPAGQVASLLAKAKNDIQVSAVQFLERENVGATS